MIVFLLALLAGVIWLIATALGLLYGYLKEAIRRRREGLPPPTIRFVHVCQLWFAAVVAALLVWAVHASQMGGALLAIMTVVVYLNVLFWGPPLLLWAVWRGLCHRRRQG